MCFIQLNIHSDKNSFLQLKSTSHWWKWELMATLAVDKEIKAIWWLMPESSHHNNHFEQSAKTRTRSIVMNVIFPNASEQICWLKSALLGWEPLSINTTLGLYLVSSAYRLLDGGLTQVSSSWYYYFSNQIIICSVCLILCARVAMPY